MRPCILYPRFAVRLLFGLSLALTACSQEPALVTAPDRPLGPLLAIGTDPVSGATIQTNQDDYAPGEIVHLTGTGWAPNETVALFMTEEPDTHEGVTSQVVADSTGGFSLHFYDVQEHDVGVTFTLTATGLTSGSKATAVFTDGAVVLTIVSISPASPAPSASFSVDLSVDLNGSAVNRIWKGTMWWIDAGSQTCIDTPDHTAVNTYLETLLGLTAPSVAGAHTLHVQAHQDDGCTNTTGGVKNFDFTVSAPASLATTTVVSGLPDPSVTGESVTFTASVTAGVNPVTTGTVDFRLGSTSCSDGTVFASAVALNGSGEATPNRTFNATETGAAIRACYSGATGFNPSEGTDAQAVNKAATSTSLSSAPDPSSVGQTVTFTAAVAATLPGTGTPTGTVNLYEFTAGQSCGTLAGAVAVGTGSLSTGSVDITTSSLTAGNHTLTACYLGDANYLASEDDDPHGVNLIVTTTTIGSSANPSVTGQQVTFTATVKDPLNVAVTTGSVTFKSGGTNCSDATGFSGPTALNGSGQATATATYSASQGAQTIRACYGGTTTYAASENSLIQTINPASTTTSLVPSPSPSVFGQSVTFTATVAVVAPGAGTPAGDVKFYEFGAGQSCTSLGGATTLSTQTLSGGSASYNTSSLSVATHTISACYLGNVDFSASSNSAAHTVNKANTTTSVDDSPSSTAFGELVTFTATLAVVAPGAGTPGGTVTFYEFTGSQTCAIPGAAVALATPAVSGSTASFDINSLNAGSHTITGCYSGDASFNSSNGSVTHTVTSASTTTTVSITTTTPQYSDKVTLNALVTPHQILTSELTGEVHFYIGAAAVYCGVAPPAGSIGNDAITTTDDGAASIDYVVLNAAGSYTVTACFYSTNANFANSGDTEGITITAEDANVTPDAGNLNAIQVGAPGGTGTVSLTFAVQEDVTPAPEPDVNDGALAGNIANAGLTLTLVSVASGGNVTPTSCTPAVVGTGYAGIKTFTCSFTNVPVGAYEVAAVVANGGSPSEAYYRGRYDDALTVYDPSLGFVTGGGKFIIDGGDRVSFGLVFNFVGKGKTTPRGNLVVVRHHTDGSSCRAKSNAIDAPAIVGNTATFSGKANYSCVDASGVALSGGAGNLTLTGYVEDNGEPGSSAATNPDKFWVRVMGELYMPLSGAANAKLLTGGNIQVPQPQGGK